MPTNPTDPTKSQVSDGTTEQRSRVRTVFVAAEGVLAALCGTALLPIGLAATLNDGESSIFRNTGTLWAAFGALSIFAAIGIFRHRRWAAIIWIVLSALATVILLIRSPLNTFPQLLVVCGFILQTTGSFWTLRIITGRAVADLTIKGVQAELNSQISSGIVSSSKNWFVRLKTAVDKFTDDVLMTSMRWARSKVGLLTLFAVVIVSLFIFEARSQYERLAHESEGMERAIEQSLAIAKRAQSLAPLGDSDLATLDRLIEQVAKDISLASANFVADDDVKGPIRIRLERALATGVTIRELQTGEVRPHDFFKQRTYSVTLVGPRDAVGVSQRQADEGVPLIRWRNVEQVTGDKQGSEAFRLMFDVYSLYPRSAETLVAVSPVCRERITKPFWIPWLNIELDEVAKRYKASCAEIQKNPLRAERALKLNTMIQESRLLCDLSNQLIQAKYASRVGSEISEDEYQSKLCEDPYRYERHWLR